MKMLSDMGSIPIASTIVSTIWVAFTAWIVVYLLLSVFRSSQRIPLPFLHKSVRGRRLLLMVRYPGNHEFPDHEKNGLDLDFLLLMCWPFLYEFPFFKIKQQAGNCFTRYLQCREKQFPDKQFLYLLRNHDECCPWILKHFQH